MQVDNSHDKSFFSTMLIVMGALFAFFFAIIFIADMISGTAPDAATDAKLVAARTAPAGNVITDASQLPKPPAPAAHAALTGEQVVAQTCSACHGAGVLGAPKIGDKSAWAPRKTAAGGVDGLLAHALSGKNQMPPRGGNADLSEAEVKGAIEFMLKQAGL